MVTKEQREEIRRASNAAVDGAEKLRAAGMVAAADLCVGLGGNCLLALDSIDEMERERDAEREAGLRHSRSAAEMYVKLEAVTRERDELLVHVTALVRAGTEARADAAKALAAHGVDL